MKRNLAVISFLMSMMVVISHDIIPHHHVDPDESEMVSGQLNDRQEQNKSKNTNQKNHFPPHQHFFSDGDFITGRNNISLNKIIKDTHEDIGYISSLFNDLTDNKYFTGFIRVIKKPLSSFPFIISINSTRGSPSIS